MHKLVKQLGFPVGHLAVEVSLRNMPHLAHQVALPPQRRADIVCYAAGIHPSHSLYPLLLVECKAVPLHDRVIRQTVGYNAYVQARYIALVNEEHEKLGYWDTEAGAYRFLEAVPPIEVLLDQKNLIAFHTDGHR